MQHLLDNETKMQQGTLQPGQIVFFPAGTPLDIFLLNETAWFAALQTNAASLLDYRLVKQLSVTYHLQKQYNQLIETFQSSLFNMDYYNEENRS